MATHVLMNHDTDKEMELLLRRHARRGATGFAGARGAGAKPEAAHMDVDELSAYAEGALPDAARLRYTLHLADCDSCRRMVTEVALSSGIEAKESGTVAQTVETPARSWREWFAALLSPPVLRYAAPALALVAFASIVFVLINRNREIPTLVTQQGQNTQSPADRNEQREGAAVPTTGTTGDTAGKPGAPASSNTSATTEADSDSTASRATSNTTAPRETGEAATAAAPKTADVTVNAAPTVQESASEAKQVAQPAQTAAPVDNASERSKEKNDGFLADQKKQESSNATMDGAPAPGAAGGRTARSTQAARSGALGSSSAGSSEDRQQRNEGPANRPATAARSRRDASGADEEYSSTATRTVAGKRFRQQNGIWVDTAYNSSRSASRVKRGSERYRALVADEPVIGAVANSFSGDVIVVSGGRAYHIY